jgi:hypothetical protein
MKDPAPRFEPLNYPKNTLKREWRGGDYDGGINVFINIEKGDEKVLVINYYTIFLAVAFLAALFFLAWLIYWLTGFFEMLAEWVVDHAVALGFSVAVVSSFSACGYLFIRKINSNEEQDFYL